MELDKIETIQGDLKFKSYFCPHCRKFLMKGGVRRLKMTCPHCHKFIDADENELLSMDNSARELG